MTSILGKDVSHLIKSIDHNISAEGDGPLFQRKVSYDKVPLEALPELRQMTAEQGQKLLENLNKSFSMHDRDASSSAKVTGRYLVEAGVYYFEETLDEKSPGTKEGGAKQ